MKTGDSGAGMKQTDIPHGLSEGTEGNSERGRKASERPGGVIWFRRKHTLQETQTHSLLCAAFTQVLPGGGGAPAPDTGFPIEGSVAAIAT